MSFQPGEGPSRGPSCGPSFQALYQELSIHPALSLLTWTLVLLLGVTVIYGPYYLDPEEWDYLTWARAAWGLCLCWVTFACVKGHGGLVSSFLSWGLWAPVSRVSFMTYLFHMSFNWYYFAGQSYSLDLSLWLLTAMFVAQLGVDLALGTLASLTLELPFGKIQKLLLHRLLLGQNQ